MSGSAPKHPFPRQSRLRTSRDFASVYRQPKRFKEQNLVASVKLNTLGHPRLGLGISKRNFPTAVMRNRLKRIIRESFRLRQREFKELDIVISVRGTQSIASTELREQLEKLWTKLIIYYRNA